MMSWVCSSALLPSACLTNWRKSFLVPRAEPSAILPGMETAARRICELSPYISCFGKPAVNS